jgi:hypothetical protein
MFRIKCEVQVSEKIQIQRIAGSRYFKKFKELLGFMKELAKTQAVFFQQNPMNQVVHNNVMHEAIY